MRVALLNDYEVVVRGLQSMLEPFRDRVEVVELDLQVPVVQPVDLTLYDTFSQTQVNEAAIDEVIDNPQAGAVVIYTWNMTPSLVEEAISKGCKGYLDKALSSEQLVGALEKIGRGATVVSPTTADEDAQGEHEVNNGSWPGRAEGLSAREAEVVALITQGLTNIDIAARSYLSINSVKSYIRSAYRKMGVERRSQAVRWGIEHGMLPDVERHVVKDGSGR